MENATLIDKIMIYPWFSITDVCSISSTFLTIKSQDVIRVIEPILVNFLLSNSIGIENNIDFSDDEYFMFIMYDDRSIFYALPRLLEKFMMSYNCCKNSGLFKLFFVRKNSISISLDHSGFVDCSTNGKIYSINPKQINSIRRENATK